MSFLFVCERTHSQPKQTKETRNTLQKVGQTRETAKRFRPPAKALLVPREIEGNSQGQKDNMVGEVSQCSVVDECKPQVFVSFAEGKPNKTGEKASSFLADLEEGSPLKMRVDYPHLPKGCGTLGPGNTSTSKKVFRSITTTRSAMESRANLLRRTLKRLQATMRKRA